MTERIKDYPGTPLTRQDVESGRVSSTSWVPRAQYSWDAGRAIGAYLEGLRAGRLLAVRCHHCRRTVLPPRAFCEQCFRPIHDVVEVPARGEVNTFSLCYVTWDMRRLEEPEVPAVIWVEGTDSAGLLHRLGEVEPQEVRLGLKVEAVWRPEGERIGAITDILHWRPVEGPP